MPFLDQGLRTFLQNQASSFDAVIQVCRDKPQTLHARYSQACYDVAKRLLTVGGGGFVDLLPLVNTRYVLEEEMTDYEGAFDSFFNINTPVDLEEARALLTARV